MRQSRDPYRTWVAEVIMQQTRMDQGLPYLHAFLAAFPDVQALAAASEDEVLRMWQGLGYYSRARNLHASAIYVTEQLGGIMPADYQGLLALKGVGKYSAAAIASWCFNEPRAAVDGNVSRVIARLFAVGDAINSPAGEKQVSDLATRLLDRSDPGNHNQAMIEFGALQCVPVSPSCMDCPLVHMCQANLQGLVDRIPVKIKNKKPVDRWFYYFMINSGFRTILVPRKGKDIWAGLYELPLIECRGPRSDEELVHEMLPQILQEMCPSFLQEENASHGLCAQIGKLSDVVRHQLSHQTIHARFLQVELKRLPHPLPRNWQLVDLEQVDNYPLPRLIHRYLETTIF